MRKTHTQQSFMPRPLQIDKDLLEREALNRISVTFNLARAKYSSPGFISGFQLGPALHLTQFFYSLLANEPS